MKKQKRSKRTNKLKKFILSIIFVAMLVLIYNNTRPLDIEKIPASFIYAETSGFEGKNGELTFGALTTNQGASRKIFISNEYDFPVNIQIKSSGEITGYIIASENNFILEENETKEIVFSVYAWEGLTEYRRYSGIVEIITTRA